MVVVGIVDQAETSTANLQVKVSHEFAGGSEIQIIQLFRYPDGHREVSVRVGSRKAAQELINLLEEARDYLE